MSQQHVEQIYPGKIYPVDKNVIEVINDMKHWANIKDTYFIQPIEGGFGKIIVVEDPFKNKYECKTCHGKMHLGETCEYCLGTKFHKGKEENGECRDCTIGEGSFRKTLGFTPCPVCNGKGGTIIIPDDAKVRTTTGTVLAISKTGVNVVQTGNRVIFTNYTGNPFSFMDMELRCITEKDLLGILKQLKDDVEPIKHESYADLENTGVPHE